MQPYVVSFYNRLSNSVGQVRKVLQDRVTISRARSEERAVEAAKKRFARAQGVSNWVLRAQEIEVERVGEGERLA